MKGYVTNIEKATLDNEDYRRVLFTGKNTQLVLMVIAPGQDIGLETHEGHDQFFRIESGKGEVVMDGKVQPISDGTGIVVPAGVEHNVTNTSADEPLLLYTLYSPPEHPDGLVEHEKPEE